MLQDEETGAWYQHRCTDFKVPLVDYLEDDDNMVGEKRGFGIWQGAESVIFCLFVLDDF